MLHQPTADNSDTTVEMKIPPGAYLVLEKKIHAMLEVLIWLESCCQKKSGKGLSYH
jgi:hypothetical protein